MPISWEIRSLVAKGSDDSWAFSAYFLAFSLTTWHPLPLYVAIFCKTLPRTYWWHHRLRLQECQINELLLFVRLTFSNSCCSHTMDKGRFIKHYKATFFFRSFSRQVSLCISPGLSWNSQLRLASNSRRSPCLCLLNTGIKGMHYRHSANKASILVWQLVSILSMTSRIVNKWSCFLRLLPAKSTHFSTWEHFWFPLLLSFYMVRDNWSVVPGWTQMASQSLLCVLVSFRCQLDTTYSHLRRELPLRNCLHQISLWGCLGGLCWLLTEVGGSGPLW